MKNNTPSQQSTIPKQNGFLLVSVLISTFLIIAIATSASQLVVNNYGLASSQLYRLNTQFAADAGADYAITQLNLDSTWPGTGGELTLLSDAGKKLTYQAVVVDGPGAQEKTVTVTGRTYTPASSSTVRSERKLEVQLRGIGGGISGSFSVVTGAGGLNLQNDSKIVGGEVYVNGKISLSGQSTIGLTSKPVNVKAAHQSCPVPADSTYPQVCGSGNGQPITITDTSRIYGEVQATNQTNGTGMSSPGLVAGSPPPAALPAHDRLAQVGAVTITKTPGAVDCNYPFSLVDTWQGNLKITGNVTLDYGCTVTVEGNVWITGNLSLANTSQLVVKNGLTEPPVIMVDGSVGVSAGNSSVFRSNNSALPIGFRVITYWSQSSCSVGITVGTYCPEVTGTALANSQNINTITLSNASTGPNTEFYSRWSAVSMSNAGNIGALSGQTIKLLNQSTVTFGTKISGVGGGSPSTWVMDSYKRIY